MLERYYPDTVCYIVQNLKMLGLELSMPVTLR